MKMFTVEKCFDCPFSTYKLSELGLGTFGVDWCFAKNKEHEFDEEEGILIEEWCPLKDTEGVYTEEEIYKAMKKAYHELPATAHKSEMNNLFLCKLRGWEDDDDKNEG